MDRSFHTLPGSETIHDTWQSLPTHRSDHEMPRKNPERHPLTALFTRIRRPRRKTSPSQTGRLEMLDELSS